jgi:hypothetical protein
MVTDNWPQRQNAPPNIVSFFIIGKLLDFLFDSTVWQSASHKPACYAKQFLASQYLNVYCICHVRQ